MTKKRVQFDLDDEELNNEEEINQKSKLPFNKKFKHTLDSDEEDDELEDEKKYEFKNNELFDGVEEGNLHNDGEITITPFNVKEELNEGHFDDSGTYVFRKEKEEIKDNWIDNIDWSKIKDIEKEVDNKMSTSKEENDDEKISFEDCLKNLLELMQPNETVQKSMQRLGKSKIQNKNKNRNRAKKDEKNKLSKEEEEEENERKKKLNTLIELSNQLLSDGDMEIYEAKFETLKYRLEEHLKKKLEEQKSSVDIFAD